MPDGDRVNTNLAPRYQKVHKQLCEPHLSDEEVAHNFLNPFKEEIRQQGPEIIVLINKCSALCEQVALDLALGNKINWTKEDQLIEKLSQGIGAKNAAKELTIAACKEQLQSIHHDIVDANLPVAIMKKYLWNLYTAKYAAKVLLKKQHGNGVDLEFVHARLAGTKQYIIEGLSAFAEQAIRHNSFDSLRRPSQRRRNFNNDLDIDLTAKVV